MLVLFIYHGNCNLHNPKYITQFYIFDDCFPKNLRCGLMTLGKRIPRTNQLRITFHFSSPGSSTSDIIRFRVFLEAKQSSRDRFTDTVADHGSRSKEKRQTRDSPGLVFSWQLLKSLFEQALSHSFCSIWCFQVEIQLTVFIISSQNISVKKTDVIHWSVLKMLLSADNRAHIFLIYCFISVNSVTNCFMVLVLVIDNSLIKVCCTILYIFIV